MFGTVIYPSPIPMAGCQAATAAKPAAKFIFINPITAQSAVSERRIMLSAEEG
jgi:hypothetical protein